MHDEMIRPLLKANTIRANTIRALTLADARYESVTDSDTTEAEVSP